MKEDIENPVAEELVDSLEGCQAVMKETEEGLEIYRVRVSCRHRNGLFLLRRSRPKNENQEGLRWRM